MTNEITTAIKATTKAAAHKVGEIEMSRRSFLKIGLVTMFGAYDVATDVTTTVSDTVKEITKPSLLDRLMRMLNFDFVDRTFVKCYLFDLKMKRLIWLTKWVESRFGLETK